MSSIDTGIILGIGGFANIDLGGSKNFDLLMTGGGMSHDKNIPYMNMMQMLPDNKSRTRCAFSYGTWVSNGNLTFDVTEKNLDLFTKDNLLKRNTEFDVYIGDGIKAWKMTKCKYSSLSLSGSVSSLMSCNISFMSHNPIEESGTSPTYIRDDRLIAYWETGNIDISDWSLSISQDVQPRYGNTNSVWPLYLRAGLWEMGLDVTTYEQLRAHDTVNIKTKSFKITGISASSGYSFNGIDQFGTYQHRFESSAPVGTLDSLAEILTIA